MPLFALAPLVNLRHLIYVVSFSDNAVWLVCVYLLNIFFFFGGAIVFELAFLIYTDFFRNTARTYNKALMCLFV
jgi:hypothetical protein